MAQTRSAIASKVSAMPRSAKALMWGYLGALAMFLFSYLQALVGMIEGNVVLAEALRGAVLVAAFFLPWAVVAAAFEAWRCPSRKWPYMAFLVGAVSVGLAYWLALRCDVALIKATKCAGAI